jgi:WD40 repeat protein
MFDVAAGKDQRYVVAAHWDGEKKLVGGELKPVDIYSAVRILDAQTLEERFKGISRKGEYFAADLSPDNKYLAAGGYDFEKNNKKRVRVWDWQNQPEPWTLGYHDMGIMDVKFSPDGRHLATASEDGMVKLWEVQHLADPQKGRILWPSSAVRELLKIAFSPDGKRLATGDGFNDVIVLDVEQERAPLLRLQGHGEMVICVAYSPDGKYLASAGADNAVRVWDAHTGAFLHQFLGHTSIVQALAFSPDGRLLASGGADQVIRLWRLDALPR